MSINLLLSFFLLSYSKQAQIQLDGKRFYLGIFDDEEDAARAFDR